VTPRWIHRLWAFVAGYFWLPCPECGRYFGGHEVRGPAYDGPEIIRPGRVRKTLCPRCEPIRRQREWDEFLGEVT